jgi:uncharacterized repeat protein (TIGR01451 family)
MLSVPETVSARPLLQEASYIIIRTASGGEGSEAGSHTMTTDDTWTLYAAGYDADDNYLGDVSVSWSVSGGIGSVSPGTGSSTTLDASTPGTGQVSVSHATATGDTTGDISVSAGDVDYVLIRTASGGEGSEAGSHTMTTDDTWTLHAAGYDADDNYVGDVSVTWSVSGGIGSVSPGTGSSTTLDASTPGTGQVSASHATATDDTTGDISVSAGDVDYVLIRTASGGEGSEAGSHTMTTDDMWTLHAAGYDADDNYVGDVSVTWSVSGGIGSVSPGTGSSTTLDASTPGTGQVSASHATATDDTTGDISVSAGDVDYVLIRTASGGEGSEAGSRSMTAGDSWMLWAAGYDADDNYVGDVSVTWSVSGGIGTVSPGSGSSTTLDATAPGTGQVTADHATATDDTTGDITVSVGPLDHITISPDTATIDAGETRAYTAEAFDEFDNSRGDVTLQTTFSIVESDHGGAWTDNVYTAQNYGTWTVRGVYQGRSDTASLTVLDTDLIFVKSDGLDVVYAGDRLTYTLTYTNSGNESASGIVITDTLPNHVEYVDCEIDAGDCRHLGDTVVFDGITLSPEDGGEARLIVRVNDPLPAGADYVTNRARMTAPSLATPLDLEDVNAIGTRPDLTISVAHEPSLFSPGGLMTYTVTYGNQGRMHAGGVIISTTLPTGTSYVGEDGWTASDGGSYSYAVDDLNAGTMDETVSFVVQHPAGAEISASDFNTQFTIAADESTGGETDPGDNMAFGFVGVPDLVVTGINIAPWPLQPSVPTVFTITVENQGTGWAWNPDNLGGFWVDVFFSLVASYPFERECEKGIAGAPPSLAPGASYTQVIASPWYNQAPILFSESEVDRIDTVYVKVDNFRERAYGLVPEYNEMNNVSLTRDGESASQLGVLYRVYMPVVGRSIGNG